jgi:hypothetical protein
LIDNGGPYLTQLADARANSQSFYSPSYLDLYDFVYHVFMHVDNTAIDTAALDVLAAVNDVIIHEQHGTGWPGAHGISIYFPSTRAEYNTDYDGSQNWLQFTANTHWDEWLRFYYTTYTTPTLIAPSNGLFTKNTTPIFSWNPVSDATKYRLQVDKRVNFSSPVINITTYGTAHKPAAMANRTYYWRVQAKVDGEWGAWSEVWTFTIDTVRPARPVLTSPVGGVTVSAQHPLFQWTEPDVVDHYQIQVDNSSRFKSPEINEKNVTGPAYTAATQLANGTYYWRVRSYDAAGNKSKWSVVAKFKMAYSPAPPAPTLTMIEAEGERVFRYGGWTAYDTTDASGGQYVYSSGSPDDTLTLDFTGTRLDVIYVKHPALGAFVVEIDGEVWQAVSCTAADTEFGAQVSFILPDGVHTARIYPQSGTIAIDAFGVEEVIAPVG